MHISVKWYETFVHYLKYYTIQNVYYHQKYPLYSSYTDLGSNLITILLLRIFMEVYLSSKKSSNVSNFNVEISGLICGNEKCNDPY